MSERRVLFVGQGKSAVCYYRCALPAMFSGADWVGLAGIPPKVAYLTGLVGMQTVFPVFESYDVVVLQQPRGQGWLRIINGLQERGVKVIYEVDDYLHGIRKMVDHDFREHFERDELKSMEMNMRVCDAMICSTEYIARRYRKFNKRTFVCENGIDLGRYKLTIPERPSVNIGWAGATGHARAVQPWFQEIYKVMAMRPQTVCVTIGQNFADSLVQHFPNRALSIPWTMVDNYPSAMTLFDIALGPAGKGAFFQGKSDLRWLEAGALGTPIIADPTVYPKVEHGVNGFHANDPDEARDLMRELVDDESLRREIGANAREYVHERRDMRVAVGQWTAVFDTVLEDAAAA